jgi:hypothetical protein
MLVYIRLLLALNDFVLGKGAVSGASRAVQIGSFDSTSLALGLIAVNLNAWRSDTEKIGNRISARLDSLGDFTSPRTENERKTGPMNGK